MYLSYICKNVKDNIFFFLNIDRFFQITVTETKHRQPQILVETKAIDGRHTVAEQLAAVLRLQEADEKSRIGLAEDDVRHWFRLEKKEKDGEWWLYTVGFMLFLIRLF